MVQTALQRERLHVNRNIDLFKKKKPAAFYFLRSASPHYRRFAPLRFAKVAGGSASQGTCMHVLPFGGKELIFLIEKILNKKKLATSYFPAKGQYHRRKRA